MMASALIAEDEPLLAQALQAELALAWPQLRILASVGDGATALRQALALQPDMLFLDIRMPGMSGLEVAADLADAWAFDASRPFPLIVFVTAYDQYALQAFEAQALDYLLKPVQGARLLKTVARLQGRLSARAAAPNQASNLLEQEMAQWRALFAADLGPQAHAKQAPIRGTAPTLEFIQASEPGSLGQTLSMVPVQDVFYIEAADKYLRVLTSKSEYLIRTPLKDLLPQLDAHQFWQVHRSLVVRVAAIEDVRRDEAGKMSIGLRQRKERLAVSRLYAHLFKAM